MGYRPLPGATAAVSAVGMAVKKGLLPVVHSLECVDCSNPATAYDHRDYNKPLQVEPVCDSCNVIRGYAIPAGTGVTYTQRSFIGYVKSESGIKHAEMLAVDFGLYESVAQPIQCSLIGADPAGSFSRDVVHAAQFSLGKPLNATQQAGETL